MEHRKGKRTFGEKEKIPSDVPVVFHGSAQCACDQRPQPSSLHEVRGQVWGREGERDRTIRKGVPDHSFCT